MRRRDQCFLEVLSQLRRYIDAAFGAGERLPSKRELAAVHAVSPATIERVLRALQQEGAVRIVPRVGYLKAGSANKTANIRGRKLRVGLMTQRASDEWQVSEIYAALQSEASRRDIELVSLPNPHLFRITLERNRLDLSRVPWNSFDVGLLVEADETIRTPDPALLTHRVLAVDQDATAYGIDSVAFANAEGGALVARHLYELGHRLFAVTDEVNSVGYAADAACLQRRHGFEAVLGESGAMLLPHWRLPVPRRHFPAWKPPPYCGRAHEAVASTLAAWASASSELRPTALFAVTPVPLSVGQLVPRLAEHGFRVPRDFSIVSSTWNGTFFGGTPAVVDGIRLTCIDFDLSGLVRRTFDAAVELAVEKIDFRPGRRRAPKLALAPVKLTLGDSTAPPPWGATEALTP